MIKVIGSYYFQGFYESVFSSADDFYSEELELKDELGVESVEYVYEDWDKYKVDVASKFLELYVEKLVEVLPEKIISNKSFEFELVNGSVWVSSPRYYNYETDKCYGEVKTNVETLGMIKDYTLKLDGVSDYLVNHFTSYDGFISFISNDYNYWSRLPISEYEDNMLISLLDMLLKLSDEDVFNDIHFDVVDSVCKYEYTVCYVECKGDWYSLSDFEKKKLEGVL